MKVAKEIAIVTSTSGVPCSGFIGAGSLVDIAFGGSCVEARPGPRRGSWGTDGT